MSKKDFFSQKASNYDKTAARVENVKNIARAIHSKIDLDSSMEIMDFGSGTGLLLESFSSDVQHITAVDVSESMNEVLKQKIPSLDCNVKIQAVDLTNEDLDKQFDGVISSMTLHHIKDIAGIFNKFYSHLKPNGFIAIADLDKEDGSFHTEDTGVFHQGFEQHKFLKTAKAAGFKNLNIEVVSIAKKPQGHFPIFLLTGNK